MAHLPTDSYRKTVPFEERKIKASLILKQHADRIPVVVECSQELQIIHPLKKNKFIVPFELTLAQFMFVIRKHMKLEATHAIFVFINNKLHPTTAMMGELYANEKDADGFMYLCVFQESTFGQKHNAMHLKPSLHTASRTLVQLS
jgi:GABA(A) receptor-associated protein